MTEAAYPEPEPPNQPVGSPPDKVGEQPQPRKRGRLWWWVGGLLGLVALLCVAIVAAAAVFGPQLARRGAQAAKEVQAPVTGYYDAIKAGDFQRAQGYLNSQLREQNTPEKLKEAWRKREAAYGKLDRFEPTGFNVSTSTGAGTAGTVNGRLHYRDGQSEFKILTLVREGGEWKLSTLP